MANSRFTCDIVSFLFYSSFSSPEEGGACAHQLARLAWIYSEQMNFKRIAQDRLSLLRPFVGRQTIDSSAYVEYCLSWIIDVIKLIVVFIYIRWYTNELSSCATSSSLRKHQIRLAVNGKGTNNARSARVMLVSLPCARAREDVVRDDNRYSIVTTARCRQW